MGLMTNEFMMTIHSDKKKYGYQAQDYMFKTGILPFDWANAQIIARDGSEFDDIGIDMGKSIMISGKPGCGKTTFGLQLAASIMKKYDESTMFYLDYEGAFNPDRVMALTGFNAEEVGGFELDKDGNPLPGTRIQVKQIGIYRDTILRLVYQTKYFKLAHKKELEVENKEGILDEKGNIKKILPPTFIFVDSIAGIYDELDKKGEEEVGSLTEGGRDAIFNKKLFKKITQPCLEANIIVIAINQETQNMGMGVTPPTASTRYLKNTQAVGGGSGIQFFTNLWINMEAGDKIDYTSDKLKRFDDVIGFFVKGTIVKSRNAEGGRTFTMVYDQRNGFDTDLSLFEVLYDNGNGDLGKGSLRLPGLEETKFRMANVKSMVISNPEFRKKFYELAEAKLKDTVTIAKNLKFKAELAEDEDVEDVPETNEDVIDEASVLIDDTLSNTLNNIEDNN